MSRFISLVNEAMRKKHIAKYAMPYTIEFRSELPKTLVGKIAYTVLEKEANADLAKELVS